VLVGAGTARAEDYGPVVVDDAVRERRVGRGQAPVPRLALVSGRLELDPGARLFTSATEPPLVFTTRRAADRAPAPLREVAEVVGAGADEVDLHEVLADLHRRGVGVVLLEGGPSLNGQAVAAGLVDEWCQTVAPLLVSGGSDRVAHGPAPAAPMGMALHRLLEEDGFLFCTYRRA
jgi:riboflavin biosynthesis pyrimidine reductase